MKTDLRVAGVPYVLYEDLKYIAKECEGVTISSYLKPKLRGIVNEYFENNPDKRPAKK